MNTEYQIIFGIETILIPNMNTTIGTTIQIVFEYQIIRHTLVTTVTTVTTVTSVTTFTTVTTVTTITTVTSITYVGRKEGFSYYLIL